MSIDDRGAAVAQSLREIVRRVEPQLPLTFVVTSLFLIATVAAASFAPAVRAARINPMTILRNE
jgi:ABC-type lipoprotein release transport system permease subunit